MTYSFARRLNPFDRTTSRRALAGGSAAVLTAGLPVLFVGPAQASSSHTGAQLSARGEVSANLFEWNWPSVANECTTVLGPAGYGSVQVAPPQDSVKRTSLGNGSDTVLHPW